MHARFVDREMLVVDVIQWGITTSLQYSTNREMSLYLRVSIFFMHQKAVAIPV